jgi:hypothetical protein
MAKVQTICVKNVAITDTCPTIQRPRWAKWSTSTPLRSLRQLGPQDLQCSQSRKHSMPETKTLRPRGKPVSSKETRHSDITPWLNPGHRDPSGDAGDPSNCQSSPGNGTSGHWQIQDCSGMHWIHLARGKCRISEAKFWNGQNNIPIYTVYAYRLYRYGHVSIWCIQNKRL